MNKIKRIIRLLALLLMIGLASILPVPLTLYRKDDMPKYVIEQIDTKENDAEEDDAEEDDVKELF